MEEASGLGRLLVLPGASGQEAWDIFRQGVAAAHRARPGTREMASELGVAGLGFSPRSATDC